MNISKYFIEAYITEEDKSKDNSDYQEFLQWKKNKAAPSNSPSVSQPTQNKADQRYADYAAQKNPNGLDPNDPNFHSQWQQHTNQVWNDYLGKEQGGGWSDANNNPINMTKQPDPPAPQANQMTKDTASQFNSQVMSGMMNRFNNNSNQSNNQRPAPAPQPQMNAQQDTRNLSPQDQATTKRQANSLLNNNPDDALKQ